MASFMNECGIGIGRSVSINTLRKHIESTSAKESFRTQSCILVC
jgi:GTP-sensing pleiotropic transcriptional regulator CodY